MIHEMLTRVCQEEPARGGWCVSGQEMAVWVDASSLATGVELEVSGDIVDGAFWFCCDDYAQHIELATTLKGINLPLQ